jgi:hypothetical protein
MFQQQQGDKMAGELTIGFGGRARLMQDINLAFSRVNIRATLEALGDVAFTGDFLDISKKLGWLDVIDGGDFARYRRSLTIPAVNQALITAAYRLALTAQPNPIPLRVLIVSGTHEIITITGTATEISLVITRSDLNAEPEASAVATPTGRRSSAPRKRAPRKR